LKRLAVSGWRLGVKRMARSAEEHRGRFLWKYVTVKVYLETGMAQTRFMNYFLLVFGVERAVATAYGTALAIGFGYFGLCVGVGWLWDRVEGFSTELEWRQSRAPFIREMRQAIGRDADEGSSGV
jgi:hypothetical protein